MATSRPSTIDLIKSLGQVPSEMNSAKAGIAATQNMVDQATQRPAPKAPVSRMMTPQDLSGVQGPYGSRPGETRLDSSGNVISGLSGIKRK